MNGVGGQSGEVCQVIDVLGHFLVLGVQRQRLRELGPSHLGMAQEPRLIRILYQLGDAVLAGNLPVERVIAVRRIRLRRLGESLLRCVHISFFHGAHAQHIELLRRSRLPGGGVGRYGADCCA